MVFESPNMGTFCLWLFFFCEATLPIADLMFCLYHWYQPTCTPKRFFAGIRALSIADIFDSC